MYGGTDAQDCVSSVIRPPVHVECVKQADHQADHHPKLGESHRWPKAPGNATCPVSDTKGKKKTQCACVLLYCIFRLHSSLRTDCDTTGPLKEGPPVDSRLQLFATVVFKLFAVSFLRFPWLRSKE